MQIASARLEAELRSRNELPAKDFVDDFSRAFTEVMDALKQFSEDDKPVETFGEGLVETERLSYLLSNMQFQLQEGDVTAEESLEELLQGLAGKIERSRLERLQKSMRSFDFDEAANQLSEIQQVLVVE